MENQDTQSQKEEYFLLLQQELKIWKSAALQYSMQNEQLALLLEETAKERDQLSEVAAKYLDIVQTLEKDSNQK